MSRWLSKSSTAAALGQRHWVFAGGLTNVQVDLRVEDVVTGAVHVYTSPLNTTYAPLQDTAAFPCS